MQRGLAQRGREHEEKGGAPPRVVMIRREEGNDGNDSTSVQSGNAGDHQITINSDEVGDLFPKFQPDLQGVLVWPDGRVWAMTAERRGAKVVTDEWSANGDYLKRFELDGTYDWLEIGADGAL